MSSFGRELDERNAISTIQRDLPRGIGRGRLTSRSDGPNQCTDTDSSARVDLLA